MKLNYAKKAKKKHPLEKLKKAQLVDVVKVLKKQLKAQAAGLENAGQAALSASMKYERAAARVGELTREVQDIRDRAIQCRDYGLIPGVGAANFLRASMEYIPYGPRGEWPARNGIHPFKRWGLETPEERESRIGKGLGGWPTKVW